MIPLARLGLAVVLVIFFLLQREDLRDRLIRLMSRDRLDVTTRALNDAGDRIGRYLRTQLLINTCYGVPIAIGLAIIGLPGALLWGLLGMLLRFIPYVGPWLAASMPILLSLAVFDGWLWPLAVIALFVGLELFTNMVMEPWLYGASTGLSPVAVLLAVIFWSSLWGGVGLLLAIPLTVCLVVAGRHLPQFEFFTILLGKEPALSATERFYQRLLTGDHQGAMELALEHGDGSHKRLRPGHHSGAYAGGARSSQRAPGPGAGTIHNRERE
ncbi:MAG: AI-2E family transporter [Gammaproteobacteria bacterium]